MAGPWPLVGRNRELEQVGDLLAAGGPAVVLAGLAGVGKTRLATECLDLATARGLATARVTAGLAGGHLPFSALMSLLPPLRGPGTEPADMLKRAAEAVVGLGHGLPLVLLVDDAHLLDDASATLVHQLVASRSVFVILTVRSHEPAPDPVTALWKDELAERIEVPPLGAEAIEVLLTVVLGGPVSAATLYRLTEHSDGNALYLRELVTGAIETGALSDVDGIWRLAGTLVVSSRLVELVEARLGGMQDPDRTVLEALAFGQPLGVGCLLALTDLAALHGLEERGLIVTGYDGRRLEARLGHPLYGEVIRARIGVRRSRQVTQHLADRVEAAGARRREDSLRFATWRLDGGGVVSAELMVKAAVTARNAWDLDLAGRLADAALDAGAGFDAALLRAEVTSLQGGAQEAEDRLSALLPLAGDDADRARLTATRVDNLVNSLCRCQDAIQVAEEAQALVTDPQSTDAVTVKRAYALHLRGRVADALDVLEPLLARAGGQTLVAACNTGGACRARLGQVDEAIALSERGRAAGVRLAEPIQTFRPSTHLAVRCSALLAAGRVAEAEEIATAEYRAAVAARAVNGQAVFALMLARLNLLRGTVATAARHAHEVRNLLWESRWLALVRIALIRLAFAHALAGRVDDAGAAIEELDRLRVPTDDLPGGELLRARAWVSVAAGDLDGARRLLREGEALAARGGDLVGQSKALHDLARLGWPDEVAGGLARLAGRIQGELAPARARHAVALASDDVEELLAVADTFDAMGMWLFAAEAAAGAAAALRGGTDDRRATAAARRAGSLARRCEGASTPALRAIEGHAGLGCRELEVAALAASGLANREIAERLSLSVRTVENQLQRVYGKLGVGGRADLARALAAV